MIREILSAYQAAEFDFRPFSCPEDPLRDRFDEWVPYYRLKYSIAQALNPSTILEIGVRYGYSARAFLSACPAAHYTGIDIDDDTFGGTPGAVEWARAALPTQRATLIVGNTRTMNRLPGGRYDLVHVDGQQDEEGIYHDLSLAMHQARYALVDGYLWTSLNFNGVNEFLLRHKDLIDFYTVIPGYAGELLIAFSPRAAAADTTEEAPAADATSAALRTAYTEAYFLNDCEGNETYKKTRGKAVFDQRLTSVLELANVKQPRRVLDVGCGRGELAYQFAAAGAEVTAVDYSASAIALAEQCFNGEPEVKARVQFVCASATDLPLDGTFDAAISSDVVEHLAPSELDQFYATVAAHLAPEGLFVVHTAPNKWLYQYDYARRRRIADSVGAYLPQNPRSRFERQMHINEQSPRVLKRQLSRHFPHVCVWLASLEEPGGSLLKRYSVREAAAAPELYALAGHRELPLDAVRRLWSMPRLGAVPPEAISVRILDCPDRVPAGRPFTVKVAIHNASASRLSSRQPYPVHISYHWVNTETRECLFDGRRSGLVPSVGPGATGRFTAAVDAPATTGRWLLQVRLVQEQVQWLDAGREANRIVIAEQDPSEEPRGLDQAVAVSY